MLFYVLSREDKDCGIQYVCQTCRFLKTRFSEHNHQMKNPHKTDNFLYRHFKHTNHSPSNMFIQHVVKNIYDSHSTKRYRNILKHKLEFKLIKIHTPHPLGSNDNIYHEGNVSKLPDFDVISLLDIYKPNTRSH